jgi:hypothetical protein
MDRRRESGAHSPGSLRKVGGSVTEEAIAWLDAHELSGAGAESFTCSVVTTSFSLATGGLAPTATPALDSTGRYLQNRRADSDIWVPIAEPR